MCLWIHLEYDKFDLMVKPLTGDIKYSQLERSNVSQSLKERKGSENKRQ